MASCEPDYVCVAFDLKGPTIRHEVYEDYKSERPAMDDSLSLQVEPVKDITRAFNITVLEKQGYEADDIIATLTRSYGGKEVRVVVVTSDKDMFQLIGDNVVVFDYSKEKSYGPEAVKEKFGIEPSLMRDLLGLAGDSSDSIPGVPGVGVKTAAKLLKEFGSFDAVFDGLDRVKGKKLKENLEGYREQALLSRELATLHENVPIKTPLKALKVKEPDYPRLEALFKEFEFAKLIKDIIPPQIHESAATVIKDKASLDDLVNNLSEAELVAVDIYGGDLRENRIEGISFSREGDDGWWVTVKSDAEDSDKLTIEEVVSSVGGLLSDPNIKKTTSDAKLLHIFCIINGIESSGVAMDITIASYLINPSRSHKLEDIVYDYLDYRIDEEAVTGGANVLGPLRAQKLIELSPLLARELKEEKLDKLLEDMELPLCRVLAAMEVCGVKVDKKRLEKLSVEIDKELEGLTERLYASAGHSFNINSPKQLSEVLFERLGLKPVRKTKTGYSTDEGVLKVLSKEHELPAMIISYRQLSKLKSTYVDALLKLISPVTDRLHTSFNQTVTATGRLSSSSPNLQNIPVRGAYGAKIRRAFVAPKGSQVLSADYSQIELRLVAHLSEDQALLDAFISDEDVHTRTASEVFEIMPGLVTPEMRRRAKAINFGIIYGMGPHGLGSELGITQKEARQYIDSYFLHYEKVRRFIDKTITEAARRGYTETIFGRRRYIPELGGATDQVVRFGERIAVNTPVQGSAADIIKAAMINIFYKMKKEGLLSNMVLQVHDELVFEARDDEVERLRGLVTEEMESVVELKVPIKVNVTVGRDWGKAT